MPAVLFNHPVKFNRALCPLYGDLYAGVKRPIVQRAVLVVKSEQDSIMVQRGLPYVAFITGNEAFAGDQTPQSHFFATAEDAITFAKAAIATHPAIVR